jgi:amino acid transporter
VGVSATARDIFNGICIGFLGASGFECTPAYIEMVSIKKYPSVIRNLLFSALLLNAPLMLLVYVHLPSSEIPHGTNILSLLADHVAGRWLRTLLVVDALLVLCGGVLTGLFTACGLLHTLAHDGVLPEFFLRKLPLTGGPIAASAFFFVACVILYATAAFQLSVISQVFSVAMLGVMILVSVPSIYPFPISIFGAYTDSVYCIQHSSQV